MKTEAAKGIKADKITISKFTEARWIQQAATLEELAAGVRTRIPAHLEHYDRILVLRARELSDTRLLYEIVEIPRDLLRRVETLTAVDFTTRTRQGGSTGKVTVGGLPAFTVRLDGSDGKISLVDVMIDQCVRHAQWIIPAVAPAPEESGPETI